MIGPAAMGSWLKRLMQLWLTIVVPSLVLWGLWVRLSAHGIERFAGAWHWLAHLLTVPLLARPLTDHWWSWLAHDGGTLAVVGFLLLVGAWALMLALPLSLLAAWLDWLSHRQATGAGLSPPSRLLYLITIPVALLGHTLRWLFAALPSALITFVLVALARFGYDYTTLVHGNGISFTNQVTAMSQRWQGLYGTVGFHHLFAGPWQTHYVPTALLAAHYDLVPSDFPGFANHPNQYPDVLWLIGWEAVMFGLIAAMGVLVVVALWKLVKRAG